MTANEAAEKNIRRVRRTIWSGPDAYLRLPPIKDGKLAGVWAHLFDRGVQQAIEVNTPQEILMFGDTTDDYVEYTGPLDEDDKSLL